MSNIEIWKAVEKYPDIYEVSNMGNVKVKTRWRNSRHGKILYRGKVLRPKKSKKGYLCVNLYVDGKGDMQYIHILVAKAFVDAYLPGLEVNHKDGNKGNNLSTNLEWCEHAYNTTHAHKTGLFSTDKGFHHPMATLKKEEYFKVKNMSSSGLSVNKISEVTGIGYNIVYRIVKGISYKYYTNEQRHTITG